MGDYMNNLMYAMEHSYSEMKIEIDQILKKKDYTTEDENSIFYAVGQCLHAMLDYAFIFRLRFRSEGLYGK